jgi:hypothetical protein
MGLAFLLGEIDLKAAFAPLTSSCKRLCATTANKLHFSLPYFSKVSRNTKAAILK